MICEGSYRNKIIIYKYNYKDKIYIKMFRYKDNLTDYARRSDTYAKSHANYKFEEKAQGAQADLKGQSVDALPI